MLAVPTGIELVFDGFAATGASPGRTAVYRTMFEICHDPAGAFIIFRVLDPDLRVDIDRQFTHGTPQVLVANMRGDAAIDKNVLDDFGIDGVGRQIHFKCFHGAGNECCGAVIVCVFMLDQMPMSGPEKKQYIENGWLAGERRVRSPNYNARPEGVRVDTLVIHGITLPPGQFGHGQVDRLFTNSLPRGVNVFYDSIADLRVSAHVLIERCGRLTQYVSFDDRAWHAGVSCFDGRDQVNDFAVGIELEGTDDCPYTPAQYRRLAAVTIALLHRYPALEQSRIVGHSDIAPGRKTDPGPAFDWRVFRGLLQAVKSQKW